jgi:hypothetical protein
LQLPRASLDFWTGSFYIWCALRCLSGSCLEKLQKNTNKKNEFSMLACYFRFSISIMALYGICSKVRTAFCEGLCVSCPGVLGYYSNPIYFISLVIP